MLMCRSGAYALALPIGDVIETMRPLPIQPVLGVPSYVAGVSLIRGAAVPVVDIARLLGDSTGPAAAPADHPTENIDIWKALDEGRDPTA